ncbi:MAG TPA: MFS transporter, partial [Daejeonella sp.]|nr:MFS transporter [Daejeonella sp.]
MGLCVECIVETFDGLVYNACLGVFVRTIDRFGKGLRTGARDAVLSDEATPQTKGKVFGFHRSMDTLGAVLAVACSFLLKDKNVIQNPPDTKVGFFSFLGYWKKSPELYRKLVIGLLVFTLFNSSDVFLLLKAKQAGLNDSKVIAVYIFYNLVYAVSSFPIGILADKIGLKKIFVTGLIIFALVYAGVALANQLYHFYILFFLYGLYAAATEGISKAWITNISSKEDTATAIGTYSAFQSICTMLASSLAGFIWYQFG